MIQKIAFIGHPTRDIERAKRFFGDVLGLELDADYGDRWVEFATPDGKSIALDTYSPEAVPSPSPYLALETDDIEADVRRLKERGVQIVRDVWANEDDQGREICRMAVILDSEGNPMMLHQMASWRHEANTAP